MIPCHEEIEPEGNGNGAEAVVDFVGEGGAQQEAVQMLQRAGSHFIVGNGSNLNVPTIDIIS
jgi:NAD+-dependent secondary alcohol dehydrogenase Adh1